MAIDLHVHSTASDGACSPADVVRRARAGGLDLIALADHDTTAGVPEAVTAAGSDLQVLPAIEISADHRGRDLHILGYAIDLAAPSLRDYTARAGNARAVRIRAMIDRLAGLDVPIEFDDVVREAGPDVHSLARPHLARVMHASGHVGSVAEAFDRFIGDDGPAYVAARLVDVPGAIRLIHEAGGIAVWAHPPTALIDSLLPAFVAAGLDGIECYRPRATDAELGRLRAAARRHGLVVTGGSDWHGEWHGELGSFRLRTDQLGDFLHRIAPAGQ